MVYSKYFIAGFESALIKDGRNVQCSFCARNDFVVMDGLDKTILLTMFSLENHQKRSWKRSKVSKSSEVLFETTFSRMKH